MTGKPIFSAPRMTFRPAAIMTDEVREQMAERMIGGEHPDQVAKWLSMRGFPADVVRKEITAATRDPFYRGMTKLQTRLRKYEWVLANQRKAAALDPAIGELAHEEKIAPDRFFADYYAHGRPVLIDGLVDHWPAMDLWSLDHIAETLGETKVAVQDGREADADYEYNNLQHERLVPFSALAERFRGTAPTNDFYITANNADRNRDRLAPLYDEIAPIPGILEEGGEQQGFFWMGPKGTITPFHHDLTNNLLVQIAGEKRVKMVAPHDTPLMRNNRHCYSGWSGADLPSGDPEPGKPRVIECTLGPGQALFLPVGWWHHVEGLSLTIGMSFTAFARPNDHYSDYSSHGEM